jgi:Skp family chaperone for outer membrane proteins
VTTEANFDQVYLEVKRMRSDLKSLQKSLDNLAELLIPEEEASPEEIEELKTLKKEAQQDQCVTFEEVLKRHGAKKRA